MKKCNASLVNKCRNCISHICSLKSDLLMEYKRAEQIRSSRVMAECIERRKNCSKKVYLGHDTIYSPIYLIRKR